MSKAFVNYVTDQPRYKGGQHRLMTSLVNVLSGVENANERDIEIINMNNYEYYPISSHEEVPYGFKIDCIQHARKFFKKDQIFWLDASLVLVKNPQPIFTWLQQKGIFLEEAGHLVGNWCNDHTLKYFGITREEAMLMPMFSAGFIGFDFTQEVSVEFFARWKESMFNGCFNGSWADHRHDMTCGSIIANQMGLVKDYSPGGRYFAYVGPAYEVKPQETVVFELHGI